MKFWQYCSRIKFCQKDELKKTQYACVHFCIRSYTTYKTSGDNYHICNVWNRDNKHCEKSRRILMLSYLYFQGIQVTAEVGNIVEEIRELNTEFTLVHSGFVISPDLIVIKYTAPKTDRDCKSGKKKKLVSKRWYLAKAMSSYQWQFVLQTRAKRKKYHITWSC